MKRQHQRTALLLAVLFLFAVLALRQDLAVRRYTIETDSDGETVRFAVITDLHDTLYGKGQKKLLRALRNEQPDAVFLVGDILDERREHNATEQLLAEMAGEFPCYYVTGNHEFSIETIHDVKELFRSYGVTVLEGDAVRLTVRGRGFLIAGVDDPIAFTHTDSDTVGTGWRAQFAVCQNAAQNTDDFSILLSHRPELTEFYSNSGFDLVVSGHAHGGQIRFPLLLNGLYAPNQGLFPRYAGGFYALDGTDLIVSRGLCRNLVPRVFNRPELIIVEVK